MNETPAASVLRDLAQKQVNELIEVAVYRTKEPTPLGGSPVFFAVELAVRRVARRLQRRPENVLLALSAEYLFLFEMKSGAQGWTVRQLLGSWRQNALNCSALRSEPFALEVHTGEGDVVRLFPKWVTPEAAQVAKLLAPVT